MSREWGLDRLCHEPATTALTQSWLGGLAVGGLNPSGKLAVLCIMARKIDQLELAALHRKGSADPAKRERYTFDFVVNGVSLFEATQAFAYDMCGCVSHPRFEPELASHMNIKPVNMLTTDLRNGVGHRAVLFGCPECGDFACGAITVLVSRDETSVNWSDFAYENGFEPEIQVTGIGPFVFDWTAYLAAISRAQVP